MNKTGKYFDGRPMSEDKNVKRIKTSVANSHAMQWIKCRAQKESGQWELKSNGSHLKRFRLSFMFRQC